MMVPRALAAALAAASFSPLAFAQDPVVETDEETGIQFVTVSQEGTSSLTFGIALPPTALEEDADEYIGLLRCSSSAADKKGWCGFSHGLSGGMTQSLLIVAWPHEDQVLTSFRYADGYTMPAEYAGNATLTQIRSKVDDTGYEVLYRCQGCFSWDHDGVPGSVSTSEGFLVAGRAQGSTVPENSGCPSDITFGFHDDGFAQSGLALDDAPNEAYEEWAALATNDAPGSCDGGSTDPSATGEPEPTSTDEPEETGEPQPTETDGEGESEPPISTTRPSVSPSREPSEPATPTRDESPEFGGPKWPRPSRPSWPDDPWDDSWDDSPWDDSPWDDSPWDDSWDDSPWDDSWDSPWDDSRDDPWDDSWDDPWDDSWDGPWDDPWDEEPEEPPFWPDPEEPTEDTRPPRPTPTFWPEPSEPEEPPSDPEDPSDPPVPSEPDEPSDDSNPPSYPTPTFWPDPWEPDEPSESSEPGEPSETSEPDEPSETSEPDEPSETSEPDEPSETSEPDEPSVTSEPDEPSVTSEPDESETDQPSETESPTEVETPEVSFTIVDPVEPPESSDLESPSETQTPEEPIETEEPVETPTEDVEEPSETEEPVEETDTPEVPEETELPEVPCTAVGEDETFDYVVIGGGAGGLTIAGRLTEAGHKVVLIEKGPPSLARWGGDMKPDWLADEELTRFDVPGLCNQVWQDSKGTCTDMDQIAGCVLGGGTAVNAGLWWEPHPLDWDVNFPAGWQSADVADATRRVFERIPGTTHPSMDGELYQQEGYDVLANGLEEAGWERLDEPNASPDQKNRTFGHTTFMYENGQRGGPLTTYLADASESENFSLWTHTTVRRLIREGGRVTGVELDGCTDANGHSGTIKVPSNGRVIISAGTFGSAKLLMRSGVGPRDQLEFVAGSALDGETFIAEEDWIELPVGENLMDHLNTDVVVEHEDVVQYNYTDAWYTPVEEDAAMYLQDRTGIFAAAAPNIGPMIWDDVAVSDGTSRQLQWTCRMEGSLNLMGNHTITMSQYLGRGVVSRGRMALTPALTTRVAALPYLTGDEGDLEAIIQGLDNIRTALADVPGLKFLSPADNVTSAEYVDDMVVSVSRRSNHWMGTNKLGEDDGRDGGTAVVDTNTQVYGLDNAFVVDGSVMPGMMTGNPSAMIVILAEHAADKILALEAPPAEEPAETPAESEAPAETDAPAETEAPVEEAPAEDEE